MIVRERISVGEGGHSPKRIATYRHVVMVG